MKDEEVIKFYGANENPYGVFCLVLTPTRELAGQVSAVHNMLK